MIKLSGYSFGATSAVMTGLAIIVGLSSMTDYKIPMITALLIIAVADNIADSFGMHIQLESQNLPEKEVNRITSNNFFARLAAIVILILFIVLLPLAAAVILSVLFSIVLIIVLSYYISIDQKQDPKRAIMQHLVIASVVLVVSYFLREVITKLLMNLH